MGSDSQYISVAEFAKRAGVSRQAIYKRLSTDLSTYCKLVDNEKRININALRLFVVNQTVNQVDNEVDSNMSEILDVLKDSIKNLEEQLERKDKEIERKDEQIARLNQSLDNAQELLLNSQKLQFQLQHQMELLQLQSPEPEEESKTPVHKKEDDDITVKLDESPYGDDPKQENVETKKRGIFGRLFKGQR